MGADCGSCGPVQPHWAPTLSLIFLQHCSHHDAVTQKSAKVVHPGAANLPGYQGTTLTLEHTMTLTAQAWHKPKPLLPLVRPCPKRIVLKFIHHLLMYGFMVFKTPFGAAHVITSLGFYLLQTQAAPSLSIPWDPHLRHLLLFFCWVYHSARQYSLCTNDEGPHLLDTSTVFHGSAVTPARIFWILQKDIPYRVVSFQSPAPLTSFFTSREALCRTFGRF